MKRAVASLGPKEVRSIIEEQGKIEVSPATPLGVLSARRGGGAALGRRRQTVRPGHVLQRLGRACQETRLPGPLALLTVEHMV
jgi:hypothetical protein